MNPKTILKKIFADQQVIDSKGNLFPLGSNIDDQEGNFIRDLIQQNNYSRTIEIGCAYGLSSLFICDGLENKKEAHHTIIDPFQNTQWHGIGINNLKQANVNNYTLIEKKSEFALPELAEKGAQFDFGFIDGWHTLDHTLVDFFYLNRMIRPGGMILIDDTGMLAIRKLVRYLINYPAYEIIGGVKLEESQKRKILESIKDILRWTTNLFPKKIRQEIFSTEFLSPDRNLGIDVSMIALKKTADDERPWNWYEAF